MVEEHPQSDMLRVLAGFGFLVFRIVLQPNAQPRSLLEDDLEPVRIAKLGDTVEVRRQAIGIVFLRARKEVLDDPPDVFFAGIRLELRKIQTCERFAVALQQAAQQAKIDGPRELRVHELLQVLGHGAPVHDPPTVRVMFLTHTPPSVH